MENGWVSQVEYPVKHLLTCQNGSGDNQFTKIYRINDQFL